MGRGTRAAWPAVLAALAAVLVNASVATAAPVTFTWSGLSGSWSEGTGWKGAAAPSEADGPVDLDFPLSTCQPDPFGCPTTKDDVAGLTVETVTLESRVIAYTSKGPQEPPQLAPGPVSYLVSGTEPLTLLGGIDVHTTEEGAGQGLAGSGGTTFHLPLVLGAANSWSVGPAPGGLNVWNTVTGHYPLAVALAEGDPLELAGKIDVGPVTITGKSGVAFGGPEANGDLNGSDGEPVDLKGGSLSAGGRVGPLTLEGAGLEPGFPGSGGKLEVNGNLSLDSASTLVIEENPNGKPREVTVTGQAKLGSAELTLLEACVQPDTRFTLVRAQGGVSGLFSGLGGAPISNGQVLEPSALDGCGPGKPAPPLRVEYGSEAVTATALGLPPGSWQGPQVDAVLPPPHNTVVSLEEFTAPARALLSRDLAAMRAHGIGRLLHDRGEWFDLDSPGPGTLVLTWTARGLHGAAVEIAAGTLHLPAPGEERLLIKLTRRGRALLAHASHLRVTAAETFSGPVFPRLVLSSTLTLRR